MITKVLIMSMQDASTFYKKMKENQEFNQKVKDISIDDLVIYAKAIGFDFTREEMLKVKRENEGDNDIPILISDAQCITDFPEVIINFPAEWETDDKATKELKELVRRLLEKNNSQ